MRVVVLGGVYAATDESGDALRFTQELAPLAAERGVDFRWGGHLETLVTGGDRVRGIRCGNGEGRAHAGTGTRPTPT